MLIRLIQDKGLLHVPTVDHVSAPAKGFVLRKELLDTLLSGLAKTPSDTRDALVNFSPHADESQSAAINSRASVIRIIAPAGSGKTQTIINRSIGRVVEGIRADRLLILTFDNAAATSLREKLETLPNQMHLSKRHADSVSQVNISTVNSFGARILRDYFPDEINPIMEAKAARRIVRSALSELRVLHRDFYEALPQQFDKGLYLTLFSLLKNQLIDPRDFDDQACGEAILNVPMIGNTFAEGRNSESIEKGIGAFLWMFRKYEASLVASGRMDFDDQKLRAYVGLSATPGALTSIQERFDEVIVDEFQDINLLDFALIKCISEKSDLVVTGDDDQAIYGFRGSTPAFIQHLGDHLHRPVTSLELSKNYRCPPNVLVHANQLIQCNERRIPKNPIAVRTDHSTIKIAATQSAAVEAKVVSAYVRRVVSRNPALSWEDAAVLYRTNAQSIPLQLEFIKEGISYLVREEDNILENDLFLRLIGVIRLVLSIKQNVEPNIDDQICAVKGYFAYAEEWQLRRIRSYLEGGASFLQSIDSVDFRSLLGSASKQGFPESVKKLAGLKHLSDMFDVLRDKWTGMRGMVGQIEDVIAQKVPLAEIYELATDYDNNVERFVDEMERAIRRAQETRAGRDQAGVSLLTYFRAKGRQWHTVVLTSCNDGVIPHRRAKIEEERRLFYVAMTRASSNLFISYLSNACGQGVHPSRFLVEAGLLQSGSKTFEQREGKQADRKWYEVTSSQDLGASDVRSTHQPLPVDKIKRPRDKKWYES